MSEDKEETYLDTVKAAVESQQAEKQQVETPPQIAEEPKADEPKEDVQAVEEEPAKSSRERDSSGRFTSKAEQPEGDKPPAEDKPEEPQEAVQPEGKPDISRPPRRLPLRTKQHWLSLSEPVREDIIAREAEFDKAFKRYDGLGQYAIIAEQNGRTLQQAVASYHQMEKAMRSNPIQGAAMVMQAVGHNPEEVFKEIARLMAPQEGQPQQPPPMQGPQGLTRDEVRAMMEEERTAAVVKAFEEDPRHHWLEPRIPGEPMGPVRRMLIALLAPDQFGNPPLESDAEEAYNKACKFHGLDPGSKPNGSTTPQGQAKDAAAVARSRQAAKATIGAPSQGSNAKDKASDDGNLNWIDTVKAAYNKAKGE